MSPDIVRAYSHVWFMPRPLLNTAAFFVSLLNFSVHPKAQAALSQHLSLLSPSVPSCESQAHTEVVLNSLCASFSHIHFWDIFWERFPIFDRVFPPQVQM